MLAGWRRGWSISRAGAFLPLPSPRTRLLDAQWSIPKPAAIARPGGKRMGEGGRGFFKRPAGPRGEHSSLSAAPSLHRITSTPLPPLPISSRSRARAQGAPRPLPSAGRPFTLATAARLRRARGWARTGRGRAAPVRSEAEAEAAVAQQSSGPG